MQQRDLYDDIDQDAWNYRFVAPFSWVISGSSGAGKSFMLAQFIKNHKRLIVPEQKRLLVAYRHKQRLYDDFSNHIDTRFMNEPGIIPKPSELQNADILIIDDLMKSMDEALDYFCIHSHHLKINVVFITQNFYAPGMRTLSLNSNYLTIYKNPRDSSQINYLSKQLEPKNSKLVIDAYAMSTERPHGYLHINCRQKCHKFFKYRDNVDAYDNCSVFVSKEDKFIHITFQEFFEAIQSGLPLENAIQQLMDKQ